MPVKLPWHRLVALRELELSCGYAHIVTSAFVLRRGTSSLNDMTEDALEEAQNPAPGAQRSEALKGGTSP